ncbi:hypothetical protein [Novosphingobium sp.]|uniref:hypothetical protein n=1 Tax=Novosphingobium sp. TaxID=1874826 RepID=UPI0025FC9B53|nr:hypothetical protein [Novosphingobium sp.]
MGDYLVSGGVTNALNVPPLSAEEAPKLRPYMALAEQRLDGRAAYHRFDPARVDPRRRRGSRAQHQPIVAAVLCGFLRVQSATVNMVNAPFLAKERGIEVREVETEKAGDYHTPDPRVSVGEAGERSVAGRCFPTANRASGRTVRHQGGGGTGRPHDVHRQRGRPRLHGPDRNPAGRGADQHRHLTGPPRGGEAVLLLSIDSAVPAGLLDQIKQIPASKRAMALTF